MRQEKNSQLVCRHGSALWRRRGAAGYVWGRLLREIRPTREVIIYLMGDARLMREQKDVKGVGGSCIRLRETGGDRDYWRTIGYTPAGYRLSSQPLHSTFSLSGPLWASHPPLSTPFPSSALTPFPIAPPILSLPPAWCCYPPHLQTQGSIDLTAPCPLTATLAYRLRDIRQLQTEEICLYFSINLLIDSNRRVKLIVLKAGFEADNIDNVRSLLRRAHAILKYIHWRVSTLKVV